MYVKKVVLQNYRNYERISVPLNSGLNIFFGDNAQGKTNFIESIYMCGTGRSHRTFKDKEVISWNKKIAYVRTEVEKRDISTNIEIAFFSDKPKVVKLGGLKINKLSDIFGCLNVVMFSPEDLKLVKEGPAFRRRFLDIDISQVKPGYYYNLQQYNKILQQRNNLLKSIKYDKSLLNTLDVWDEQLSSYGSKIVSYRAEFINKISILAKLVHRKITSGKEELNIYYSGSFKDGMDRDDIKEVLYKDIVNSRKNDIYRGSTSVGPHRDDIEIYVNNIDVKVYGSQGQQRTAALSLKLSELEFMKGENGEYPVLLLDDVLSELDINRQKYLLENLKDIQTIITCTSINDIIDFRKNDRYIYKVSNGSLCRVNI
jgi:DNA replication and repair protein RecF